MKSDGYGHSQPDLRRIASSEPKSADTIARHKMLNISAKKTKAFQKK